MKLSMATTNKITNYRVTSSDLYFFDNNVWMYIFGPIASSNRNKQNVYSSFFKQIQSYKATIFINSLVISEYANSCLRLNFNQWKKTNKNEGADYKRDYISTEHYKESAKDVITNLKLILKFSERHPDDFNAFSMDDLFNNLTVIDFNDNYYANFCIKNKFKIVTDDKDFQKINNNKLEIITYNI